MMASTATPFHLPNPTATNNNGPAQASATSWTKPLLNPPSPQLYAPEVRPNTDRGPTARKRREKKNEKTLWEKIARERIVMKGTARGRDERLPAEDLSVEELGVKERRARVLCATCTCGARQDHARWLLATFRFGSTSNVATDCAERHENERSATVEGGKQVWSCGKESTQDAVLQGKRHRLPSWQGGRGVGGAGQGIAGLTGYGRGRKFG